jgi:hypothetical protein
MHGQSFQEGRELSLNARINLNIVSGLMAIIWCLMLLALVILYYATGEGDPELSTLIGVVGGFAALNLLICLLICLWDRFRP